MSPLVLDFDCGNFFGDERDSLIRNGYASLFHQIPSVGVARSENVVQLGFMAGVSIDTAENEAS